ncbi:restriction endonuclease subunit S [Tuberibacillus calidus]|uniref:restriction endonuclease subunit S n=1 Tax=Tuberibacillus calidus TaxID=340097 RepID=UPI0004246907|nr:restriction endonuclease subunit S [Tuberibacillus calidus]
MKRIKIKDIFEIKKGKKVEPVDESTPNKVRYIQIEDLRNDSDLKYCLPNDNYVYANKESIIIAWDGANAGTISYGLEGAIGSTLAVLVTDKKDIYIPYIGKYLQSKFNYFQATCTGATIPHISRKALEDLLVPIPSLEKQRYISKTLDKVISLIDKRKAQIEALDQLTQSVFLEMFGDPIKNPKNWNTTICKKVTEKIGSGATPKGGNASYKQKGISLIRSMNVYNNNFNYTDLAFIDEEQADKLKNVIVYKDDILLNITGASVARSCIVPNDVLPARVNQHVSIIRVIKQIINPIFLSYMFTNEIYQNYLLRLSTSGGATREAITKKQIENLPIITPPIDLQEKFANIVKQIEQQKSFIQKSIGEIEILFNSLMQKSFKGELFTEERFQTFNQRRWLRVKLQLSQR